MKTVFSYCVTHRPPHHPITSSSHHLITTSGSRSPQNRDECANFSTEKPLDVSTEAVAANDRTSFDADLSSTPAIELHRLTFAYPDLPPVLRDLDLQIDAGERVGLVGPNGAGKTTLFLTLCGVLQPTSGEVRLFGKAVVPGAFRPDVGLVFQNPSDQLFSPTVWDDVAFGVQNMGLSPEQVDARVGEALELTGVAALAERPPHHLSGGQKRMVAIAGILAMRPKLVIYDEPSANLDLQSRRRLIQFLQTSRETVAIASHDLDLILEVCDRVLLLDGGCVVADGSPMEVLGNDRLMENHGLEKPHSLTPHVHPFCDLDSDGKQVNPLQSRNASSG
ncbi:energy-coupling factor ABC transporter ATP-binding protein [Baaleninema sp.]|uniref:energy-coupling factor ABC transporter ATP-binding protein n=1 Tax=Baaleninema sp. TaxID=3101197 RepID=UPI003D007770